MEQTHDASTNLTGNGVTSQLEVDFSGLNLDNESNRSESTASNVNIDRETDDLDHERIVSGIKTGAEAIDLQDAVSTPGAGEGTTQLSSIHSNAEVGNVPAIESQNKRRDEYIQCYAKKLVQNSCNVNLFILCQEVLTNKRHKRIHEIVNGDSISPVEPKNPTFTIVLWNVNGPTIPKVTRDTKRERNGKLDAYVYRVLDKNDKDKDKNMTIEDLKRIANIQTMGMTPFEVGLSKDGLSNAGWESVPEKEITKWYKRMSVVLCDDILIVSWHGRHNRLTRKQKRSNVDLMMNVVQRIRSDKNCKEVIIGGDFNIDVDLIKDKFPDFDIFPPPEKTRSNNTLDFVVTWPKKSFLHEIKVDEGPFFTHPKGKRYVFDHKIVKYTLKKVNIKQN